MRKKSVKKVNLTSAEMDLLSPGEQIWAGAERRKKERSLSKEHGRADQRKKCSRDFQNFVIGN